MRKLKLEMQVSLDGFTATENGEGDWMVWGWGEDWGWDEALRRYHIDLTTSSDTILLSRKMAEEGFHAHWENTAANPDNPRYAFAKPIVDMRKVVFTKTLRESIWPNTELAKGDLVEEVNRLKQQPGKDLIVYGGPIFASSLAQAGLIDEFNILVNPAALGRGKAMLGDISGPLKLRLLAANAFDCGVTLLRYEPRR